MSEKNWCVDYPEIRGGCVFFDLVVDAAMDSAVSDLFCVTRALLATLIPFSWAWLWVLCALNIVFLFSTVSVSLRKFLALPNTCLGQAYMKRHMLKNKMKQLKEYVIYNNAFIFLCGNLGNGFPWIGWAGFLLNICIVLLKEMKAKIIWIAPSGR